MVATMEKTEASQRESSKRTEEAIKRSSQAQMQIMKAQFEEISKDLLRGMEGKMEWMETEMRE